jgi:hypothetical protein
VLTNLLDSDDVRHMLNALKALGVHYTLSDDRTRCEVTGNGGALRRLKSLSCSSATPVPRCVRWRRPVSGQQRYCADRRAAHERASDWPSGGCPASGRRAD